MAAPDIEKEVVSALQDLKDLQGRVLPVVVGKEVVASIRQNFRSGGFYGKKWKATVRQTVPFRGVAGKYGPLLSKDTHLMSSTDYIPGNAQVTIRNSAQYAQVHNEGDKIKVTPKMKRFFWAKYYETSGKKTKTKSGKESDSKANDALSKEADFWKAMALKKPGSKIRIPQRQFLGRSDEVQRIVRDSINKALQHYIQTHFK